MQKKSFAKSSKNEVETRLPSVIDFYPILTRFWSGFGKEKRRKIDPRRDRKSDAKEIGAKTAKKRQEGTQPPLHTTDSGPLGMERGGVNPSPKGRRDERWRTLNHLSPKGWWDSKNNGHSFEYFGLF